MCGSLRQFFRAKKVYERMSTSSLIDHSSPGDVMHRSLRVCFALVLLLCSPGLVFAQDAAEGEAELAAVLKRIDNEETRLQEIRQREKELRASLAKVQTDREKAKRATQLLQESLQKLNKEQAQLAEAIQAAKDKSVVLREGFEERLIAIYKTHRRSGSVDYLFRSTSATDLLKRAYYLEAVARFDRAYLDELTEAVRSFEKDRLRLVAVRKERSEKLEKVKELDLELEKQKVEQARLLREERRKAEQRQKSLDKLKSSAARIENVMAGLTGSETAPAPKEVKIIAAITRRPTPPKVPNSSSSTSPSPAPVPDRPFRGRGLASLKGSLEFPVPGRLIQRFGKQQHEEFADILFVKGLEVKAPVGAVVRAVADGKVIFNKSLPGYGKVLILDHGQRYYTLYGRIALARREVGEVVQGGEVVAELGASDAKGRNFYFELRIKGKATDPSRFFSSLPEPLSG